MKVRVAGTLSDSVPVNNGVPQGTEVGPLLFLMHLNYITTGLSCSFKIFADDLKTYSSFPRSTSETLPVHLLDTNIDYLVTTSSSWGSHTNHSNCAVFRISQKCCRSLHKGVSPYKFCRVIY